MNWFKGIIWSLIILYTIFISLVCLNLERRITILKETISAYNTPVINEKFVKDKEIYDVCLGKGIVVEIAKEKGLYFPVRARFGNSETIRTYTPDGRYYLDQKIPQLYTRKVKIVADNDMDTLQDMYYPAINCGTITGRRK